jgi:ubiquinone biosynthesis protein COQ4
MARRSKPTWGFRVAPRQWLSLFRAVREDPDDVALGARVFFSIGGHDEGPTYKRFLRSASGRRVVENRSSYTPLLTDYEALRALPDGTLGREYMQDLDERGIDPIELARLTEEAYVGCEFSPDHEYVRDRVRHAHDLLHTLTGYGVDILGEAGVLAFTFGQTGNKGWAMLVALNLLSGFSTGRFDGALVAWKGYQRGRRASFVPAADDWEHLLRLPIDDARAELGITPLMPYRPMALDDIFRNAPTEAR